MRMCIACRQSFPKRELVRVVRLSDGGVTLDPNWQAIGPWGVCVSQKRVLARRVDEAQRGIRVEDDIE